MFRRYGSHSSVLQDPEVTRKVLVKETSQGYTLTMDPRLLFFILNCHLTPQGIVDLHKRFKKPRPIFDSSFCPEPWCFTINDWTDKSNEPEIVFPEAFIELCIWVYNLRITYPTEEIYLADDDCSGAF